MRKKICILTICLIAALNIISVTTFASTTADISPQDRKVAKEKMIDLGFDKDFIENAPDSELNRYLNAELISKNEEYYRITDNTPLELRSMPIENPSEYFTYTKISKEIFDKEVLEYKLGLSSRFIETNQTSTSWAKLSISAMKNGSRLFTVGTDVQWIKSPFYQLKDVLALGHDTNLTSQKNSAYFFSKAYRKSAAPGETGWVYNNSTSPTKWDTGGVGFTWNLPKDMPSQYIGYTDHYANMAYDVKISDDTYRGNLSISSTYAHQQTTFSVTPSFTIPAGGSLSLNFAEKYDTIPVYVNFRSDM